MPTYLHECTDCKHEWEDFYSITAIPPTACPKCLKKTARRLIAGGSGKGIVEISGHELVQKTKEDARKFKQEVSNSEKLYANVLGESKYQGLQQRIDRQK